MKIIKSVFSLIMCFCMIVCFIQLAPQAAAANQVPLFKLTQISNDSATAVVQIELVSGGFSCVDFRFNFKNVTCSNIKEGTAYQAFRVESSQMAFMTYNENEVSQDCCNISIISTGVYDKIGDIAEITLDITDSKDYSFSVSAIHCAVLDDNNSQIVVEPTVEGCIAPKETAKKFYITESGAPFYIAYHKVDWRRPYSSKKLHLKIDANFEYDTVIWASSNPKVSVANDGTVYNRGFFARKSDITALVYDADGNLLSKRTVTVGFYKFKSQLNKLY